MLAHLPGPRLRATSRLRGGQERIERCVLGWRFARSVARRDRGHASTGAQDSSHRWKSSPSTSSRSAETDAFPRTSCGTTHRRLTQAPYRRCMLNISVNQRLCIGNGVCAEIAPEVFALGDDEHAYLRDADGRVLPRGASVVVPQHLGTAVLEACDECPAGCIDIEFVSSYPERATSSCSSKNESAPPITIDRGHTRRKAYGGLPPASCDPPPPSPCRVARPGRRRRTTSPDVRPTKPGIRGR